MLDGQQYPMLLCECVVVTGAVALKGPMTYAGRWGKVEKEMKASRPQRTR